MRTLFAHLIVLVLMATTAPSIAGRVAGSGRLVEWIPFSQENLTVSAAVGRSINTVVIYNPDRLEQLAPEMIQFVIRRQDFAAYLAADLLRGNRQFSKPWGSLDFPDGSRSKSVPFSPIREEQVYAHEVLRRTQERGLDCLAFLSLEPMERLALRDLVRRGQGREDQGSLVILPSTRRLTTMDMTFFESETCAAIPRGIRQ